ncbi:MAG: F0F1 ATP synthase subunit gamma [Acidimicrobiia bacterium]|nr:F0F1 ATP synthase subunit gamma [Acidimicrobiia bacterium]MBV9040915.1 F0F1 ATP synthase subunit gamma [Acidimicrobiia bacterium]
MASGQERILRRRIRSVQSTKKITRAMELIAASRIVKAQQRVAAARPYSEQITEVIRQLAAAGAGLDHPLLKPRDEVKSVGFIAVTADRGLAGAYNASVIRTVERAVAERRRQGTDYTLVVAGKKAESYFRWRGYNLGHAGTGFSEQPHYENAKELADVVIEQYQEGQIDEVQLVYTRFLSMGTQRVVSRKLLPLDTGAITDRSDDGGPSAAYEFEPDPNEILERLLPTYVEARVFAALLDAAASEQAARQRAMKAATDNAEELIKNLSIDANKLRQAGITTEIMEIVGGAEALRQASHHSSEADAFREMEQV